MSKDQVINDPIHGSIRFHPLLQRIIDTPQFQRLRDIKQLGLIYWIFPGASHNRFEHSIGTSYLCGEMIEKLRDLHSNHKKKEGIIKFEIKEAQCLCIKIAGLCRNLGHGPFSNFFDRVYMPRIQGNPAERRWKHEQASCLVFDFMLREDINPGLNKEFEDNDIKEEEKKFIKALILGDKSKYDQEYRESFFFEIVNNNLSGIDCGKFDYFARDCHNVGVRSNFDFQRYFQNIRIVKHGDNLRIAVRDKAVFNLYELFHTRWSLHHRVYRHKTEAPIEDLLAEALSKVDEDLGISASTGDMFRFTNLTDNIIYDVLRRNPDDCSENMKEAQAILQKIQRRQLYKFCGQIQLIRPKHKYPCTGANADTQGHQCPSKEDIAKEIAAKSLPEDPNLHRNIFISIVYIHYGKKHDNPIDFVLFFDKSGQVISNIEKDLVSHMLPQKFEESYLRVYAKSPSNKEEVEKIRRCFKDWSKEKNSAVRMNDDPHRSIQESCANNQG